MVTLSEIRAEARKSLAGKWGKAALLMLAYGLITCVISLVLNFIPFVGAIIAFVIGLPITYGFLVTMIKLKRGEEVSYTDFLTDAFSGGSFGKVWAIFGHTLIKMILPIVLMIIFTILMFVGGVGALAGHIADSNATTIGGGALLIIACIGYFVASIWGTIKGLLYTQSYFIYYDNKDMAAKDIVNESEKLMKGNRWRFFLLPLTFIGWMFLAGLTLGIGMLWLTPYMMVSMVCFYESLAGTKGNIEVEPVKSEE